jgi:hypothetical protein
MFTCIILYLHHEAFSCIIPSPCRCAASRTRALEPIFFAATLKGSYVLTPMVAAQMVTFIVVWVYLLLAMAEGTVTFIILTTVRAYAAMGP